MLGARSSITGPESLDLAIPLALFPAGKEGKIVAFMGGKTVIERLSAMGFSTYAKVKVLSSSMGPVLVEVEGSRIALGRGIAMKIMVDGIDEYESDKPETR